jgi:peptidoglycan-N-acetylglucosamine deacetylase
MSRGIMNLIAVILIAALIMAGCNNSVDTNEQDANSEAESDQTTEHDESNDGSESNEEIEPDLEEVDKQVEVDDQITQGYKINESNWKVEPLGEEEKNVVLLTIDDAPDKHGVEMAKILKDLEVGAIFFVNGHFINSEEGQAQLKEIYEMGFEIGNHTMNHKNLRDVSEEDQYAEIVQLNDLIEDIIGERPRFFRAPFGANTDYSEQVVKDEGMVLMNWTYGYDWEADYMEAAALADIMVNTPYLTEGANLLMHDRQWTMEALDEIVTGLEEKGYRIIDPKEIKGLE